MMRTRTVLEAGLDAAWTLTGGWGVASIGYLVTILVSATAAARAGRPEEPVAHEANLFVVVPAHDEEAVIARAVTALIEADYPRDRYSVVVIADNCSDDTAQIAGAAGADVWVREDPVRGKGAALAWAIERAFAERPDFDALVVIDADCVASKNLLSAVAGRLAGGASAVQVDYVAGNPEDSPAASLRYAAFLLMNTVRPWGKAALGLSSGLLGTGMAFSRRTLREVPWDALSVTEDREYHLRLIVHGLRVSFAPEARVTTPVPTTLSQGSAQQVRWDTGNAMLARQWGWRLIRLGAWRRNAELLHAGVEVLVPPQTMVTLLTAIGWLLALVRGRRRQRQLTVLGGIGQAVYVFGGVSLVGSPRVLVRVLRAVPGLIAARARQQLRILGGRGARTFVRTERTASAPVRSTDST